MARDLTGQVAGAAVGFDEFVALLDDRTPDLRHEDGVVHAATALARLAANSDFLVQRAVEELKDHCSAQQRSNNYGAQVLMLHQVPGRYFVRANFWPALDDPVVQASGTDHYFYHIPHDHNFDFVTVGYAGPGYRSRWFEYDHDSIAGYVGEPVALVPVEDGMLHQGRVLHYRAHRDVHDQLPPSRLSISLNIVPEAAMAQWRNQYLFDVHRACITGLPTITPAEIALRIAAAFSAEGLDIVHHLARRHPAERVRWRAWRALIGSEGTATDRLSHAEAALMDQSALVRSAAHATLRAMALGDNSV